MSSNKLVKLLRLVGWIIWIVWWCTDLRTSNVSLMLWTKWERLVYLNILVSWGV